MTDKEKISKEVERLQKELIKNDEKGFGSDIDNACILELQNVLTYIDSLQEEPVSKDLEEAAEEWDESLYRSDAFIAGAQWQKEHLWKDAQGDDLPEIDREVIALLSNGTVVYAHRPQEYWDGKNIATGEVTRHYPKRHDKGGWNIPDVKFWLDCVLPKIEE